MKWYPAASDNNGNMYNVKVYHNGTKVWWTSGRGPVRIEYHTGDTVLFNADGSVYRVVDSNGKTWEGWYDVGSKRINILFGEMGAGKTYVGKLIAKNAMCDFFDGDDVAPQEMIERVKEFKPLTREMVSNYVQRILAYEIERRANASKYGLIVAQALYSDHDRKLLGARLAILGFDIAFFCVKVSFWRNMMQLWSRKNGLRWILYWLMNKPFFEKPTHEYMEI